MKNHLISSNALIAAEDAYDNIATEAYEQINRSALEKAIRAYIAADPALYTHPPAPAISVDMLREAMSKAIDFGIDDLRYGNGFTTDTKFIDAYIAALNLPPAPPKAESNLQKTQSASPAPRVDVSQNLLAAAQAVVSSTRQCADGRWFIEGDGEDLICTLANELMMNPANMSDEDTYTLTAPPHPEGERLAGGVKPCPFCGEAERIQIVHDEECCWRKCMACEATGPVGFKRGDDDDPDWNTRAPAPPAHDAGCAFCGQPNSATGDALLEAATAAESVFAMFVQAANRADTQSRISSLDWRTTASNNLSVRDFLIARDAHKALREAITAYEAAR